MRHRRPGWGSDRRTTNILALQREATRLQEVTLQGQENKKCPPCRVLPQATLWSRAFAERFSVSCFGPELDQCLCGECGEPNSSHFPAMKQPTGRQDLTDRAHTRPSGSVSEADWKHCCKGCAGGLGCVCCSCRLGVMVICGNNVTSAGRKGEGKGRSIKVQWEDMEPG